MISPTIATAANRVNDPYGNTHPRPILIDWAEAEVVADSALDSMLEKELLDPVRIYNQRHLLTTSNEHLGMRDKEYIFPLTHMLYMVKHRSTSMPHRKSYDGLHALFPTV